MNNPANHAASTHVSGGANSLRAWVVCLSASLFFFYEFIQMNMFNAISESLMHSFHIDATGLSRMSAFYFIANVLFLFPAGVLLDRFSTRKIILVSLTTCIIGTFLFSTAQGEISGTIYRFIAGIGAAFCFLSVIRLASRWFQATHLALVTGIVVTIAMAGGMVAQTPLRWLVSVMSWRHALWIDAALGVVIFVVIYLTVRDYPPEFQQQHDKELQELHQMGYWRSMGLAFLRLQNWLGGIYTCLMNLLLIILGGLWGVAYLHHAHGVSKLQATNISMMLFLGTIIGAPIVGWWSDRIGLRRLPMMIGAIVSFVLVLVLIYMPHLSFSALIALFLVLGFTTSTQIIGYPIVAESSLAAITAMSVSVVNITTQGGIAAFEPLFGHLMDIHARLVQHHQSYVYLAADFKWAMWLFPIGFALAFFAALALNETYCKPREDSPN